MNTADVVITRHSSYCASVMRNFGEPCCCTVTHDPIGCEGVRIQHAPCQCRFCVRRRENHKA